MDRYKRWLFRAGLIVLFLVTAAPGGGKRIHH